MELSKNTKDALELLTKAGELFQQERKESYLFIASTMNSASVTDKESSTGAFCIQFGGSPQEISLALIGLMRKDPILKLIFMQMFMAELTGEDTIMTKAVSVDTKLPAEEVVKAVEENAQEFQTVIQDLKDKREAEEFQANPPMTKA